MRKNKFRELFSTRNAVILIVGIMLVLLAILAASLWQKSQKEIAPGGAVAVSNIFRWTGKAADGKWSTAANWDQNRVPNANAQVVFDATSSKDSSVDLDFGGEIASLDIKGYVAKIKQDIPLKIDEYYYQESGEYEAAGSMEVNGDFTQTGESIFTATSGDTRIAGDFAYNDGFKPPVEEAMVFVKVNDAWKSLTITGNGAKDYYAVKETNSTPTAEVWSFYNITNFLQSYVSLEKGWSLGGGDKAWGWSYVFAGLEREGKGISATGNSSISAQGNRVTLKRDENTEEWYENTYKGIEQGFTIKKKPVGNGELVIKGSVATNNMSATKSEQGDIVGVLISDGNTVFNYGHLSAKDAQGKDLPVTMNFVEAGEGKYELDMSVDDSGAQYPIIVDPIATTPDWMGSLNKANSQYGKVATLVGDVNGDGRSDFLVTARAYDGTVTEVDEGAAFLYYGTDSGISNTPAWSYESHIAAAEFGHSASAAGDVNNDGYDDFIVGADGVNGFSGRIYLFLGGPAFELTNKGPSWTYDGPIQPLQKLGQSVSNAGDVNGDGYDDIIAGAHFFDAGAFTDRGKALVFYGNNTASGLSSVPDWTVMGGGTNAMLGFSVSEAGNVDKDVDGCGDILIGAPGYNTLGAAYLYYGDKNGLSVKAPQTFTHTNPYVSGAYFGNPVSPGGDMNNDGYPDILIGSSRYDISSVVSDEGAVFAYYGGVSGFSNTPSWSSYGAQSGAFYGSGLYTAGDVNGDGFSDVIVGACMNHGVAGQDSGKAWLFLGGSGGLGASSVWNIEGQSANANLGWYASTAGNVNGDGAGDFLVSAYNFNSGTVGGQAYLFYGAYDGVMKVTEICNNGIDDDGNGLPDALDPVCAAYVTDQKSTITVQVSTKDESNWFSDRCNIDTNADGIKDKRNASCLPSPALGAYLQCDSEGIASYDSQVAKNSYTYFRDFTHSPCNRDDVHDDFFNTDSTSPIFVQSVDENFTITARGQDNVGVDSVQILWINANTISPGGSEWSAPLGKHTCTGIDVTDTGNDVTDCKICIKGGNCGIGNDVIDPSSLGIPDGKTQQRLFFMVIVTDASMSLNITRSGYENDPVLDKYYRLHICSSACHNCVNTAPTVALDKYEEPDFCQGLGYKLYWTFTDPDGQSDYELQLQDKDNPAAPILSTVRTSSANNVTITDDLLSGKLEYGKTYKWRVRAYDNSVEPGCQAVSAWTAWSSDLATDISFHTPSRYPIPSFTTLGSDFNTDITFTSDSTVYVPGSTYKWYIDDMATVNQTVNPAFKNFTDESQPSHNIKMSIIDGEGHHCEITKNLMLGKKYPIWNEVAPLQD